MNSTDRPIAILAGTLVLASGAAVAADKPDTSEWKCDRCPFSVGAYGATDAEAGQVTDDSTKFGEYNDLEDDDPYLNADFDMLFWTKGGFLADIYAEDLGLATRTIDAEIGRPGRYNVRLGWDEKLRHIYTSADSVYTGLGSQRSDLPDDWVRAGSTAGFTTLDSNLSRINPKVERDAFSVGFGFVQSPRLTYDVDWRHEEKDGTYRTWGSFLGNAAELGGGVDYDTDIVRGSVKYTGERWQAEAGLYGSFFTHEDISYTWENAFTGPDLGRLANDPDNKYYEFSVGGLYRVLDNTTASLRVGFGKGEQDDDYIPYTINPDIETEPLPQSDLNGEVDTTRIDFSLRSSPVKKLGLTARYRYDDRNNQTDRVLYQPVESDLFRTDEQTNLPYSFESYDIDLIADWRFNRAAKAWLGIRRDSTEYDFQEIDEREEDAIWGKMRLRPTSSSWVSGKITLADRDVDRYELLESVEPQQNPLLRKYNLADRDRKLYELDSGFQVADWINVGVNAQFADDQYKNSKVGLRSAQWEHLSLDAIFPVFKNTNVRSLLSHEEFDSRQIGAASNSNPNTADPNWQAKNKEKTNLAGLGVDVGMGEKWDLTFDYTYAESEGDIFIFIPNLTGARDDFPQLTTRLNRAELNVRYKVRPRMTLEAGWLYERYRTDDWSVDDVQPDTVGSLLSFGANSPDYDVSVFSLKFNYRLEDRDTDD